MSILGIPLRATNVSRTMASSFQFIGGWHMTKERPKLEQKAEYLCVMGDMARATSTTYQELLAEASRGFRKVFVVAGRCEYGEDTERTNTDTFLEDLCQRHDNLHFMRRNSVTVRPDLVVAGTTLRLWPRDECYASNFEHLLHELRIERSDGKKVLYLSYGVPKAQHLGFIDESPGQRMLVPVDWDKSPPSDVLHM
jgi:hypothetical protein